MLIYLDQNYASRVAKYLRRQPGHAAFGEVHRALCEVAPLVPPSPFHVLETRGGYLLPTLQALFARFSRGWWVRPYQDVVRLQLRRQGLVSEDLLTRRGDWAHPATLDPLSDLLHVRVEGGYLQRTAGVRRVLAERFGVSEPLAGRAPFFRLLARLVAFRGLDDDRAGRPSDLTDLVMAATVAPYVRALATDRYLRETLQRVGHTGAVFSGRRPDVVRFAAWLRAAAPDGAEPGRGRGGRVGPSGHVS